MSQQAINTINEIIEVTLIELNLIDENIAQVTEEDIEFALDELN